MQKEYININEVIKSEKIKITFLVVCFPGIPLWDFIDSSNQIKAFSPYE